MAICYNLVTIICEKDFINPYKKKNCKPKKVVCLTTNKIYESASSASRDTGVDVARILKICTGERKATEYSKNWKFYEEKEN